MTAQTATANQASTETAVKKGMIPAIIGSVAGLLAIFTIGIIFFPIALVCTIIAFILSFKSKNGAGIGVSCLSLVLTICGFATSPTLWLLFMGATDSEFRASVQDISNEAQELRELMEGNTGAALDQFNFMIDFDAAYEIIG